MQNKKGSVLVFTLLIMLITLAIVLGIVSSSMVETKSVLSTKNSAAAFQIADSGIEVVSAALRELDPLVVNDLDDVCDESEMLSSCSSGECSGDDIGFSLYFYDKDGDLLDCDSAIDDVHVIKSVGTYQETARAIEINLKMESLSE